MAPSGQPDLAELRRLARRQVAPALERLAGVAEARITGGRVEEVRVLADRYRMDAFGVSLKQLEDRLQAENVDISAGTLEEGSQVFVVRGMSRFRTADDVANVVVLYLTDGSGGRRNAIRVSDIAEVQMVAREIDHLVRVDGTEGVGVAIYKEAGTNTVAVSATVQEALADISRDLPNVEVREIVDEAALVVDALDDLETAAIAGIVLAVLVLAVFLRSAGATLVVATAVPVSIFAALFLMRLGDRSLNIVTLGGLALGAGMLVDNAIVVVESIYRRLAEVREQGGDAGEMPQEAIDAAVAQGTGRVAGAITATTLTTCVVFLPVLFVEGLAARLIDGIAFAVVVSLLASLAVAVFLIPALGRWFLRPERARPGASGGSAEPKGLLQRAYSPSTSDVAGVRVRLEQLVSALLRRPFLVVLAAAALAAVAITGLARLGTELLPPADPRQFSVRVVGPSAQRVESTSRAVEGIESLIRDAGSDSLAAMLAEVGRLPEDDRLIRTELTEENTARVIVRMTAGGPTGRQLATRLGPELEGMEGTDITWEVEGSALADALGGGGPPITVEVSGNAITELRRAASRVKERLDATPEVWNARSSFEGGPPELRLTLDRALADAYGIDLATLSRVVESSLDGRIATTLTQGDEEHPVTIRLPTPRRDALHDVVFRAADGRQIALGSVAQFNEVEGAREIFRRDQRRTAQVTAQVADGFSQPEAVAAVRAALADAPVAVRHHHDAARRRGRARPHLRRTATGRRAGSGAGADGAGERVRVSQASHHRAGVHSPCADRRGGGFGAACRSLGRDGHAGADRPCWRRGERCGAAARHRTTAHGGRHRTQAGPGSGIRGASQTHRDDHPHDGAGADSARVRHRRRRRVARADGAHHHRRHHCLYRRLALGPPLPIPVAGRLGPAQLATPPAARCRRNVVPCAAPSAFVRLTRPSGRVGGRDALPPTTGIGNRALGGRRLALHRAATRDFFGRVCSARGDA